MRKEDMRQAGQLMLTMNVFSYMNWVTNVPKSHPPDYPVRIRLECCNVGAGGISYWHKNMQELLAPTEMHIPKTQNY